MVGARSCSTSRWNRKAITIPTRGQTPSTEKEVLGPLEKAYYSGLMDEAEFKRIRDSMEKRKAGEDGPASRRPAVPQITGQSESTAPDPGIGPESGSGAG